LTILWLLSIVRKMLVLNLRLVLRRSCLYVIFGNNQTCQIIRCLSRSLYILGRPLQGRLSIVLRCSARCNRWSIVDFGTHSAASILVDDCPASAHPYMMFFVSEESWRRVDIFTGMLDNGRRRGWCGGGKIDEKTRALCQDLSPCTVYQTLYAVKPVDYINASVICPTFVSLQCLGSLSDIPYVTRLDQARSTLGFGSMSSRLCSSLAHEATELQRRRS